MMIARMFLLPLLFLLTSCMTTPRLQEKIHIAPAITITLPSYTVIPPAEASQMVIAHYGDKVFAFRSQVSINAQRCLMVGLDSLGDTIMTIRWDKKGVTYEKSPLLPGTLHPENILADFVLVNAPENVLRHALSGKNITLITTNHSRSIRQDNKEIIHIDNHEEKSGHPWTGQVHYHHLAWQYTLDIKSVEQKK